MLYRVHAKREAGFRRAGRFWPAAPPVLVDLDEATAAVLLAEPMLDVRLANEEDLPAPAVTGDSIESLRAKVDALLIELAAAREAGKRDAEALGETMQMFDAADKELSALKSEHEKCAAALKSAQESCAKLREENKALKSKKDPPPSAPAPAAEAKSEDKAA
jgi:DNA repair exonuclease SbcCD ATPase subunit